MKVGNRHLRGFVQREITNHTTTFHRCPVIVCRSLNTRFFYRVVQVCVFDNMHQREYCQQHPR